MFLSSANIFQKDLFQKLLSEKLSYFQMYHVWLFMFLSLCMLSNFYVFCRLRIFSKLIFSKNSFGKTTCIRVSNALDPDEWFSSCVQGKFNGFCCLQTFFKINFFKKFFQENYQCQNYLIFH